MGKSGLRRVLVLRTCVHTGMLASSSIVGSACVRAHTRACGARWGIGKGGSAHALPMVLPRASEIAFAAVILDSIKKIVISLGNEHMWNSGSGKKNYLGQLDQSILVNKKQQNTG